MPTRLGAYCGARPEVYNSELDTTFMSHASGLCVSSSGNFYYAIDDSPGQDPRVFAFARETMRRTVIEVVGLEDSGFNPTDGVGYGDWEAVAVGTSPSDETERCIIIADIGHRRTGTGTYRQDNQPTRLIYVEEPVDSELLSKAIVCKVGRHYPFRYSSANLKFDARALTVCGDSVYIITRNARQGKCYVYACANAKLMEDELTTFDCIGEMTIQYSRVVDAFAISGLLALRTYVAINFYNLADLRSGVESVCQGHQMLPKAKEGPQEAMAYDATTKSIVLLGKGAKKLYCIKFDGDSTQLDLASTVAFHIPDGGNPSAPSGTQSTALRKPPGTQSVALRKPSGTESTALRKPSGVESTALRKPSGTRSITPSKGDGTTTPSNVGTPLLGRVRSVLEPPAKSARNDGRRSNRLKETTTTC